MRAVINRSEADRTSEAMVPIRSINSQDDWLSIADALDASLRSATDAWPKNFAIKGGLWLRPNSLRWRRSRNSTSSRSPRAGLPGMRKRRDRRRPTGGVRRSSERTKRATRRSVPYQALAFAVRNEERAFAFYTYVSAETVDHGVRALAEDLARDELDHASRLRRLRRRAFHKDRPLTWKCRKALRASTRRI